MPAGHHLVHNTVADLAIDPAAFAAADTPEEADQVHWAVEAEHRVETARFVQVPAERDGH